MLYRKTRTVVTIAGVALGVMLVVLTVGLVHGFLNEQGRRNSAVTAEIQFFPTGTFTLGMSSTLSMPIEYIDHIKSIDGVGDAVPIGQVLQSGRVINGIDYRQYEKVSEVQVVDGRAVDAGDEAMIDRVAQSNRNIRVGESIELFDRPFEVVGVYEPESLGRIKIPLPTMQQILNRPGLCSLILIKVRYPSRQEEVAQRIQEQYPKNAVHLTKNMPILYARGTPALQTFMNIVIGLAVIVSSLVILLAMYTTVTERTRQIGILKSLGASRLWIAGEVEKEALLLSFLGVLTGFGLSIVGKQIIKAMTNINVEFEAAWLFYALVVGLLSGVLGALYPALRAANQDPVKALSYE